MDKEILQKIISESRSKKEAVEKLGFKSFLKVKKLCKNLGVDCSFLPQTKIGLSIEEKFNKQKVQTSQFKKELIKAGLKKYEVGLRVQRYFVTALLEDTVNTKLPYIFAILGENYKLPDDPCWFTIKFETLKKLEEFLVKFKVIT